MDPLLSLTIALALAGLLGFSALHQLRAWREWPGVVRNYRLLPEVLLVPAVVAIPLGEILVAAALPWPALRTAAGIAAAFLLLGFALAIAINIARGRTKIDCGCFGSRRGNTISTWMVVRNAVLAMLALGLLLPGTPRPLSPYEVAAALVSVATLVLLYPVLDVVMRPRSTPLRSAPLRSTP